MPGTILVPVDGSEKDARALAVAADLARLADASLAVVRVRLTGGQSESADPAHAFPGGPAVPHGVSFEVIDGDDAAAAVLARAAAVSPVAIVMATRAPQALDRAIHGSVADRIVREATCPVMLVPPGADFMSGHELCLRHVLVPLDESAASRSVLGHLLAFANAHELDLELLSVVEPTTLHSRAEDAEATLNELVAQVRARGAAADARVIEAEDPAATIAAAIRQDLVDFIAMSTRGAGGLERLVFGSVATAVVRASEIPVLLVTPATRAPGEAAAR